MHQRDADGSGLDGTSPVSKMRSRPKAYRPIAAFLNRPKRPISRCPSRPNPASSTTNDRIDHIQHTVCAGSNVHATADTPIRFLFSIAQAMNRTIWVVRTTRRAVRGQPNVCLHRKRMRGGSKRRAAIRLQRCAHQSRDDGRRRRRASMISQKPVARERPVLSGSHVSFTLRCRRLS